MILIFVIIKVEPLMLAKDEKITWIEGLEDPDGILRSLEIRTSQDQVWQPIKSILGDEDRSNWVLKTAPNMEGVTLAYVKGLTNDSGSCLLFHWKHL